MKRDFRNGEPYTRNGVGSARSENFWMESRQNKSSIGNVWRLRTRAVCGTVARGVHGPSQSQGQNLKFGTGTIK